MKYLQLDKRQFDEGYSVFDADLVDAVRTHQPYTLIRIERDSAGRDTYIVEDPHEMAAK